MRPRIAILFSLILAGCATVIPSYTDVSDHPDVHQHIGRRFVLQEDLYLISPAPFGAHYPLLKGPEGGPRGISHPDLPSPVDARWIGYKRGTSEIIGVWRRGTTLRFDRIFLDKQMKSTWLVVYLVSDDPERPRAQYRFGGGLRVAKYRTLSDYQDPWFFDYYAEELPR